MDATPNLDQLRDEKCLPVAQALLVDMAEKLLDEDATPLISSFLARGLAADLNITSEASYIPQLILSALSGLNATIQGCDLVELDDERYREIGRKMLAILAFAHVRMNGTQDDVVADVAAVKDQLNTLFVAKGLNKLEVKYITDSIFQAFTNVNNGFSESLTSSAARAEAKLFGIGDMTDLTMKKLDDVLTASPEPVVE